MLVCASLTVALLCAQTHGEVAASLRTEIRARSAVQADGTTGASAGDLDINPAFAAGLSGSGVSARLSYSPTLRWREPFSDARRTDTTHVESFSLDYSRDGQPRPYLVQGFSYGLTDLTTLFSQGRAPGAGGGAPSAGPVPSVGVNQEIYVDALVGVRWPLAHTVSLDTNAGYTWGGGADAASRLTLPLQNAVRATVALAWAASRVDTLTTLLNGQLAFFRTLDQTTGQPDAGTQIGLLQLAERWERAVSTVTRFTLGAGAALGGQRSAEKPALATAVVPIGQAAVSHRLGVEQQTLDVSLSATAAPFIDRYLATVYERVEGSLALAYRYRERFLVNARASLSTSVGATTTSGLLYSYFDASVGYQAVRYWQVSLNGAGSWAQAPAGGDTTLYQGFQWVVGLSVTVRNQGTF